MCKACVHAGMARRSVSGGSGEGPVSAARCARWDLFGRTAESSGTASVQCGRSLQGEDVVGGFAVGSCVAVGLRFLKLSGMSQPCTSPGSRDRSVSFSLG